jgi:hypothetical protein
VAFLSAQPIKHEIFITKKSKKAKRHQQIFLMFLQVMSLTTRGLPDIPPRLRQYRWQRG